MELNLEDKIKLISGKGAWHTNDCDGKLPSILMTDGPHGLRKQDNDNLAQNNKSRYATAFPTASGAACSWDPELIAKEAEAIADEALAEQVSIVLGPGINIKRSPLCGRNFEYYSEDPFLAGSLATAYVNAMQAKGVGTSLKHYAGNSQESHRMTSNSQIDERALREIYTSAFEMTVKDAQPTTIMACYNRVNGEYGCQNKHLLTELLRDKWGFKGAVISDWGACTNLPRSIQAGMDLEMPGNDGIHFNSLRDALVHGQLDMEALNRASSKIADLAQAQAEKLVNCEADLDFSHDVALELSSESAVLLKNDGLLPLKPGTKVVVIGDLALKTRFQGGGSSHIHTRKVMSGVRALKDAGLDVKYAKGYSALINHSLSGLENYALSMIEEDDIVLFYGGLTDKIEGEGYDRSSLDIPENQRSLMKKILEKTKNVAFIAFGGAPMNISFRDDMRSILLMYLGGQAVAESAAMLITGKKNPCGKLAETFPMKLSEVPSYNYFDTENLDVEYRESIFVGYRYYQTYQRQVMYPFGFGLSYTNFEYSNLIAPDHFSQDEAEAVVKLTVTNTGQVAGKEIVQLYIANPKCRYMRAARELRGFAKTKLLQPGEAQELSIRISPRSFSLFDVENDDFIVPSGNYKIEIGASVTDIRLSQSISVSGVEYRPDVTKDYPDYFYQNTESFTISKEVFAKLYKKQMSNLNNLKPGEFTTDNSLRQLAEHSAIAKVVMGATKLGIYGVYHGKPKDDPEVMMMLSGALDGTLDGAVCQSGGLIPPRIADAIVASANGKSTEAIEILFGRR